MKKTRLIISVATLTIASIAAFASTNFAYEKYQIIGDCGTYWVLEKM